MAAELLQTCLSLRPLVNSWSLHVKYSYALALAGLYEPHEQVVTSKQCDWHGTHKWYHPL